MERKIVQHGPATMMVSLPAKWIKKKGLKKGDSLFVDEKPENLILSLDKKKHKSTTSINLSSLEESSIRTVLTNAYRLGYDKINISFEKKEIFGILNKFVDMTLLGFEITKKTSNSVVIESITEPSLDQFDNIFSKVFMNIEDLFLIGEEILNNKKSDDFEDIGRKILQLDNFCKRVLVKNSFFENNFLRWAFHSNLIHAIRELHHLYKYLLKNSFKISKSEMELFNDTKDIFLMIKGAYYNQDLKLLEKIHKMEKDLTYKKGYVTLKKSKNPIIVHHLVTVAKHFYLSSSPLMGMVISRPVS